MTHQNGYDSHDHELYNCVISDHDKALFHIQRYLYVHAHANKIQNQICSVVDHDIERPEYPLPVPDDTQFI